MSINTILSFVVLALDSRGIHLIFLVDFPNFSLVSRLQTLGFKANVLILIFHAQIQFTFLYGLKYLFQAVSTYFQTNLIYYAEELYLFDDFQDQFFTTHLGFPNLN